MAEETLGTLPLFGGYKVDLDVFEGPLDLLLHLIRKEEVDIYDIPIGRITAQYMAWLGAMQALDIDVAGEFIVMASTLMVIKSRMLLPRDGRVGDGEPEEEIDPRLDLVRQLVAYRRCKDAADGLARLEALRADTFPRGAREAPPPQDETALRLGDLGVRELLDAFARVLERSRQTVSFGHLKQHTWSVPDMMRGLIGRVAGTPRLPFADLFPPEAPKGQVIVTFIALLELLRLRHIRVTQAETFGEITVESMPAGPDTHLPLPDFETLRYA